MSKPVNHFASARGGNIPLSLPHLKVIVRGKVGNNLNMHQEDQVN